MSSNERDERFRVSLPIFRKPFEIFEYSLYSDSGEERDCVLSVLVEVGIENALVHEVSLAIDREKHPTQVMQFEWGETVGHRSHCVLNVLRILVKDGFAAGNNFGDDGESVTCRSLRVYRAIFALLQLCGVPGYCHCLRFDVHGPFSFLTASGEPFSESLLQ